MREIAVLLLFLFSWPLAAQDAPRFEVDPSWPGSLPDGWINGQVGGVCVDAHDHIVIVDRRKQFFLHVDDQQRRVRRTHQLGTAWKIMRSGGIVHER